MKFQYAEFYPEILNKKSAIINPAFLKYKTVSSGRKLIVGGIKPDRVGFPEVIYSINIIESYKKTKQELPDYLDQWKEELDFHLVRFPCMLKNEVKARGIKRFKIEAEITSDQSKSSVQVIDAGPKTKWVKKPMSLGVSVNVGIDFSQGVPQLKKDPNAGGKVLFEYKWEPKVAAVITGNSNNKAEWTFNKSKNEYLDGKIDLIVLIQRKKNVSKMNLIINKGESHYDFKVANDMTALRKQVNIPIKFKSSTVQ
ncbi:MAG: hypothetical protein OEM28_02835 [Nitrosopumilus sp.]|nr:hypothetical protein [Nitrosopumilus sp.]MDH3487045.1 hypothetical protein [Nitrosopumilus sp.]